MNNWKRIFLTLVVAGFLITFMDTVALADPYRDGGAAYNRQDYKAAMKLWLPLANHGNTEIQFYIGMMYADGMGAKQDDKEAMKWFRKAADQGYAMAQSKLGMAYVAGVGVKKDYVEAVKWSRKAAEQGDVAGQATLGYLYAHGEGIKQDYVQAYMWLKLAEIAGNKEFESELESITNNVEIMTPEKYAEAKRLVAEWTPTPSKQ